MNSTHELKTDVAYYVALQRGKKNFEVRYNDRDYKVGDTLVLKEWCAMSEQFTGDQQIRIVEYILEGGTFGIPDNTVVMGLRKVNVWDLLDNIWWKLKELMDKRWVIQ
jgi:hypothetical protein